MRKVAQGSPLSSTKELNDEEDEFVFVQLYDDVLSGGNTRFTKGFSAHIVEDVCEESMSPNHHS